MRLEKVCVEHTDGRVRLKGEITGSGDFEDSEVWFEYPDEFADFLRADADVFLPLLLVAAMVAGEAMETDLPVSAHLVLGLHEARDIYHAWYAPTLQRVEIRLPNVEAKAPAAVDAVGAFFSAGADSFHTILRDRDGERKPAAEITHLIHMTGFETPLGQTNKGKEKRIREVADRLSMPIISGSTNLRDVFPYDYSHHLLGPTLGSTALSLSGGFREVVVPSNNSCHHEDLYPCSSHLFIDPLWSTEYLRVHDDGHTDTRPQKVAYLVSHPDALADLVVCTESRGDYANCGKCRKCVRTMISLAALGALEAARLFPSPFDYSLVKTLNLKDTTEHAFIIQNLELARSEGRDPKLVKALERHLSHHEKYRALVTLVEGTPLHPPARWLRQRLKSLLGRR